MTTVRVLSYNIRALRDDAAAVCRVIRASGPDVACLQEAPRFLGWRGKRSELARRSAMTVAAGRRAAGLAVFAAQRTRVRGRGYRLLARVPRLHRRGVALALMDIGGARLVVANVHLDLEETARRAHAAEVVTFLDGVRRRHGAPVVLAGDINEEPGGPAWELLGSHFGDAFGLAPDGDGATFSAQRPSRRIDAIFASTPVTVVSCGLPAAAERGDIARASDHRPVLAELALG